MGLRSRKSTKSPPIFSHEFIIQNHADIVSCVAMVFVIGIMFQATAPVASLFVAMQHNVTRNVTMKSGVVEEAVLFTNGSKDLFSIFFYTLICIVIHAVVQEYLLDKMNRKLHLSKVKHSKFNESGQLLVFYLVSVVWGIDICLRENISNNIRSLWEGYPHTDMQFLVKFFFIIQIAYWLHSYPELYFMKVKKDEMVARIQYSTLYLAFGCAGYFLNFSRVSVCALIIHYLVEALFHLARLLYFSDKKEIANTFFMVWNGLFVLARLTGIILSVLTFWYGLAQAKSKSDLTWKEGNFNTFFVRINCLVAMCFIQGLMMWNFIIFHLKRLRDKNAQLNASKKFSTPSNKKSKKKTSGEGDASENGNLKTRSPKADKKRQ